MGEGVLQPWHEKLVTFGKGCREVGLLLKSRRLDDRWGCLDCLIFQIQGDPSLKFMVPSKHHRTPFPPNGRLDVCMFAEFTVKLCLPGRGQVGNIGLKAPEIQKWEMSK